MDWANRKIRFVIPPVFIRFPTRIKNGIARRGNPVVLEYILAGTMHRTSVSPRTTKKITAVKPMDTAMGSPTIIKNIRTPNIAKVIIGFPS
jgi:hypothetical protein